MTTIVVPFPTCMATNEESADSESPSPLPTSPSQPLKHRRNNSMTKCLSAGPMAAASRLMSSLTKQSRTPPLTTNETNNMHEQTSVSMKPFGKRSSAASRRRSSSPESSASTTTLINSSTTTSSDLNQVTIEYNLPTPETIDSNFNFESNCTELRDLAESNCRYFSLQKTDVCRRFSRLLMQLIHSLELSIPLIRYLTDHFHKFDYSPEVRANGYRTLVTTHGLACLRTLNILRQVDTKRVGLLFNLMYSSRLFQELESWTKALDALERLLALSVKMMNYSNQKSLYVDARDIPMEIELEYFKMVSVDPEFFFGRTCGFQFSQGMQTILTFLLAGLATYSETYQRSIPFAAAHLATAPKYLLFPEQRAKKCATIFRDCDYLFCKSFWNLVDHDYIKMGSRYIAPNVTVSKYFQIGPEPIQFDSIVVYPPSAPAGPEEPSERLAGNIGAGSENTTGSGSEQPKQLVNVKLLSHEIREGMNELPLIKGDLETSSNKILPMSDQLLMHVHGGGFIATSSATHEIYLKPWALGLEIPIVSIDYSLAPEYPFPRAIEECFYAYAWILKNASRLGWTGKTILLAGDSAGGNLVTIVTMKAIEMGLRKPDGILCFYTPFLLGYSMSPSRLMAIMDPLLNTGFLWRCLAAYAGVKSDSEPPQDELPKKTLVTSTEHSTNDLSSEDTYYARLGDIMGSRQAFLIRKLRESTFTDHRYMSPLRAPDEILRQFPTTYLIACHEDPLLDDSVSFARHLKNLAVEHYLILIHDLTHGFLNFYTANHHCKDASDQIISDIARRYQINEQFSTQKKKKSTRKKNPMLISNSMMNS